MATRFRSFATTKLEALKKSDEGFSLIELLVVVLIIGILSAIAIPIFLGQQNSAKDAATKSDLGNAKIAMISYATDNGGSFEGISTETIDTTIAPYGYSPSEKVTMEVVSAGASAFCLSAVHDDTDKVFYVTQDSAVTDVACQ